MELLRLANIVSESLDIKHKILMTRVYDALNVSDLKIT